MTVPGDFTLKPKMWGGDVVAHWGCGGSIEMWRLSGDVVAQWGCGNSMGMWRLSGDVVARWH
jgi:hypothetical protein